VSDQSRIEWTEATWNPVTGCTKVSPGCDHCYAEQIARRFAGSTAYPRGFTLTLRPGKLDQPIEWRRPRRIFVNSMSDLFHADVPIDYIARVFAVMHTARQHTFQLLTKRHGRLRALLSDPTFVARVISHAGGADPALTWPLPNVWVGVSVESERWARIRIPALAEMPAAVRFLSAEPLLGPLDLTPWLTRLDWIIAGGESGRQARPMHPAWPARIAHDCQRAGTAFFFKQWGSWVPVDDLDAPAAGGHLLWIDPAGRTHRTPQPGSVAMAPARSKNYRQLGGRIFDTYPEARA
jgi:protein gp37